MSRPLKVRLMRQVVEYLGRNPKARAPFFWSTFYNLRLVKPVEYLLLRELMGCESVLDLGCGRHSMVPILPKSIRTVGVELFEAHYREAAASGRHGQYIQQDITKIDFPERSFDGVAMLDVLEHLTKKDGQELIDKMCRWARKKVVIFTPNGFLHQHEFDGNPYMEHRSGWDAEEFRRRGFRVFGVRGLKSLMKEEAHDHDHDHAGSPDLTARLTDLTQVWTYGRPESAFQLFAVKTVTRA